MSKAAHVDEVNKLLKRIREEYIARRKAERALEVYRGAAMMLEMDDLIRARLHLEGRLAILKEAIGD